MKGSVLMALQSTKKSLAETNPELAAQWHPTKNGGLTPNDFSRGSKKKVWWQCRMGHEWQAQIDNRSRGTGCPDCRKEFQVSFYENVIFFYIRTVYPDAIQSYKAHWLEKMEIDIFIPSLNVGIEYDGKMWHKDINRDIRKNLLCKKHNVDLIRIREQGCPCIDGKNITLNTNDVDGVESAIKILFYNHLNCQNFIDIDINRDAIEIKNIIVHTAKQRSLLKLMPQLAKEWHPTKNGMLRPEHVLCGSHDKVWWMCSQGHEWLATIKNRCNGTKCPYCTGKKVLKGYNDLQTTHPELVKEWDYKNNGHLKPEDFTINSGQKVWWKCSHGHQWLTRIVDRKKRNCPYCANKKTLLGYNDLMTTNPLLANEWHPTKNDNLNPENFTSGSNKFIWWKCGVCGHEWRATINSRNRGNGCPVCAKKRGGKIQTEKFKKIHLEESKVMNCGFSATIIEWRGRDDIDISFEDGVVVQNQSYSNFKRGTISHPFYYQKIRIGETKVMNNGQCATIIAYRSSIDIDVQFEDGTIIYKKQYRYFIKGAIRNPQSTR